MSSRPFGAEQIDPGKREMTATRSAVIFDHDGVFCAAAVRFLGQAGWRTTCLPPERGAERLVHDIPDVVVVEPCPRGTLDLAFLKAVMTCWGGARVIVVTAYPSLALGVECVRAGVHDCFSKPLPPDPGLAALIQEPSGVPRAPRAVRPSLASIEREYISQTLRETGGNISAAARLLGIRRSTLQRKLRKYPPSGEC
jgi:two-component system response regulator RegA